ncbi:cytochrome c oxidase subunit 3 [Spiribacter halobius]|uniref:Cytochrome oxidase subunit III n=1 Tax=Sediminicurvatus halobius TaxID=2182432 RepID=A0A2U2N628_9GAMM|nr:cytochrome oxidase subunit III [Spiribacter halobius]PWG64646.1 cytochrome oxidase subunit III [Spiribacter halobius]UEX79028.1 hypothetical protein LMH63_05140 [Spiribacter halobius]
MTVTLVFLALLMAGFAGWLVSQSVNVRPWVAGPLAAEAVPPERVLRTGRLGLAVFLAVVTSLFALAISAYLMRMEHGADWRALPEPGLLWVNSACLVLASLALQRAWGSAARGGGRELKRSLAVGGALTVLFVAGQLLAWRQLVDAGYYLTANPANAFFMFLTALHAAHLIGGLLVWARLLRRARAGTTTPTQLAEGVGLCALYWHYLLLLWAILFALLLAT